jgi:transaldolase / glucose-6-phosphate isomerase
MNMAHSDNPLRQLERFGQSVWLDFIRRRLLSSAEFRRMIEEDGLKGMTSNPTIFEKAIAGSDDYDEQLRKLARTNKTIDEIYEIISMDDIRAATGALRPLYDRSGGNFGYVSYEVSPLLANDTEQTIAMARRYWDTIDRPNLMVKVPSTPAGIPAIEQLIAEGRNINVTLMFSVKHYEAVAEAYLRGLERRVRAGEPLDRIASVASIFVSRVDTLVDKRLEEKLKAAPDESIAALRGEAAVANAKLIYERFKDYFQKSDRFKALAAKGARLQRVLWASTGTKNPAYSDVKYVQELIAPETVNTMPPATMDAFRDHGQPRVTIEEGMDEVREVVRRLAALGIDLNAVGEELQEEGVKAFAKSFEDLREVIKGRREAFTAGAADPQAISAPSLKGELAAACAALDKEEFPARLWKRDPSLWKKEPEHQKIIRDALGWLGVAQLMAERVDELKAFAESVKADGFRDVVLLGMGGSSLCPEVFARTFPSVPGYPRLSVLDSTVPDAIRAIESRINLERTLFVVSTKSGGTIETLSHLKHFYALVKERKGEAAGSSFFAITDPDTNLEKFAIEKNFRHTFLNPHDIGGRYSALSYFGLVPAALIGMDVAALLDRAVRMTHSSAGSVRAEHNPGVSLGAFLGASHKAGRDKVTFVVSPPIAAYGLWVEQLIAESTGKESTGLVPVVDEPVGTPQNYGSDRTFAYLRLANGADPTQDKAVEALQKDGMPLVRISVADKIDLGEEFMRWEIATATAGSLLGIDAFDQPNVQESKDNTARLLKEFEDKGKLPSPMADAKQESLELYCAPATKNAIGSAKGFGDSLRGFLGLARPGDYFAIMAYVAPGEVIEKEIAAIRTAVRDRLRIATTFGYGPRFLHSTGQLHKGGPNTGLFLQITQDHRETVAIPGERYDFATLNEAQHLGDFQALQAHGRHVVRVHLHGDPAASMAGLRSALTGALPS